jgi:glycosyltransferase involved in cell wall biosynthesis
MNTKKKILFLVTQSEFGGAQRFIYRLITNLDSFKYEIITAAGPEGNDANGLLFNLKKEKFKVYSLKFLRRTINPLIDFLGVIEIYKLIKREKPDIVFLCSTKAGILGSIAGRWAKTKKTIYRIGGWTFNDPWPSWKKKLYIWLEKITAGFKDIIVNNAESDRQQAMKLGIKPREKIMTIYNGINIDNLDFLPKEEAKIFLGVPLGFAIGTIANFYPPKGLIYLVEAINLILDSDIKFVLIGDGQQRAEIENLIHKYKLEEKLLLTGTIPEAYKYLKAFDVFVLPSIKEGFPWTLLEAMTAGVPVIATKVGAVPEVIENNHNGLLIEPANSEELAKAIKNLLKNKDLREKIVKEAKKTVEEKFNLKEMVKKYENLLSIN